MNKIQILGLITLVVGFIVTGIGTFVGSNWNLNNLRAEGGPYSHSVGWVGIAIVTVSAYVLSYEKKTIFLIHIINQTPLIQFI